VDKKKILKEFGAMAAKDRLNRHSAMIPERCGLSAIGHRIGLLDLPPPAWTASTPAQGARPRKLSRSTEN
jgi:hypothetical protein